MDLHMHTLTSNIPTSRACTMSLVHTREKPKRGHNPQPVTAKCCRALLLSDKMEINYTTTSTFLSSTFQDNKTGDNKSIFGSYNRATCNTIEK